MEKNVLTKNTLLVKHGVLIELLLCKNLKPSEIKQLYIYVFCPIQLCINYVYLDADERRRFCY